MSLAVSSWLSGQELKEQYHYFNYYPAQSLQNIADRLAKALSCWQSNISGFPRYKSQRNKTLGHEFSLYFINQQIKVDWSSGRVTLPKGIPALKVKAGQLNSSLVHLGVLKRDSMLRLVANEHFERKLQNATLKLEGSKLVISFVYTVKAKELVTPDNNSAVSIDRGVAYPCAISNGTFANVKPELESISEQISNCQSEISHERHTYCLYRKVKAKLSRLNAREVLEGGVL